MKKTFHIKKKNLSRFTVERLLEILHEHYEIRVYHPAGKDFVSLSKEDGSFYRLGKLSFLNLNYLEWFRGSYYEDAISKPGAHYYMSNQSENFHPTEEKLAIDALLKRAGQKDHGFRTCGMGYSLAEVMDLQNILDKAREEEKNVVVLEDIDSLPKDTRVLGDMVAAMKESRPVAQSLVLESFPSESMTQNVVALPDDLYKDENPNEEPSA